jgi:hypothetical protein
MSGESSNDPFEKGYDLIVMDLIPNAKQLHTCWHSFPFLANLEVVLTVRFYLVAFKLRLRPLPVPSIHSLLLTV